MDITCEKCGAVSAVPDKRIPTGRSYFLCPQCEARINIFKSLPVGCQVVNLAGLRFFRHSDEFHEEHCEPGELWRVVDVVEPCPDKGKNRSCELENRGRCPNQRLILRLSRDRTLYRSCMYRNGRKIFERTTRSPVGAQIPISDIWPDEEETHRVM